MADQLGGMLISSKSETITRPFFPVSLHFPVARFPLALESKYFGSASAIFGWAVKCLGDNEFEGTILQALRLVADAI